jgi:hypothetical protein
MSQAIEPTPQETATTEADLVTSVQRTLQTSGEPLTLSKIRARLPVRFREISLEELTEVLNRQVTAQVVWQFPKYRSQQDRYWDRPMPVHIATLLRSTLSDGPLAWSELRRKLPGYAQPQAEAVLDEALRRGELFRYPRLGRGSERFGTTAADPREYLRGELTLVFDRLEQLGFHREQLRTAAVELLQEEEWGK